MLPKIDSFPNRLRYARLVRGLTQFDLAMCLPLPVHEQTVGSWERGESEPRPRHLKNLAAALKVTVPWLAEGKGNPPA